MIPFKWQSLAHLASRASGKAPPKRHQRLPARSFRPAVERFEDRIVATTTISPTLSIPTSLIGTPGSTVVVPVNIDNPNPSGGPGPLAAADLAIDYDPAVFTVAASDVQHGTVTDGWALTVNNNAVTGQLAIGVYTTVPPTSTVGGSLVLITMHIKPDAVEGTSAINLVATNDPNGTTATTRLDSLAAPMQFNLPVTNAANDPGVDGVVAITPDTTDATHLAISAASTATAGNGYLFTVTALDESNNVSSSYNGTVHFSSTDPGAVLPDDSIITAGMGIFRTTFQAVGIQTLTVNDQNFGSFFGASSSVTVNPGSTPHFALIAPSSLEAGNLAVVTAIAEDPYGNVLTGYAGTVHFSSSDAAAVLPANTVFVGGVSTFVVILRTAGNQTLSASDITNSAIAGTSKPIAVSGPTLNPDQQFIQALFLNALGRAPDASEFKGWVAYLNQSGHSRQDVAATIEQSWEARTRLVEGWFATYLGRQGSTAEIQSWVQMLSDGATEPQVQAQILASAEFGARANALAGSADANASYIQALYGILLGRTPSGAEVQGWLPAFQSADRESIALMFLDSTEYRMRQVSADYLDLLDRTATQAEVMSWVLGAQDLRTIRYLLESSPEFYLDA